MVKMNNDWKFEEYKTLSEGRRRESNEGKAAAKREVGKTRDDDEDEQEQIKNQIRR